MRGLQVLKAQWPTSDACSQKLVDALQTNTSVVEWIPYREFHPFLGLRPDILPTVAKRCLRRNALLARVRTSTRLPCPDQVVPFMVARLSTESVAASAVYLLLQTHLANGMCQR